MRAARGRWFDTARLICYTAAMPTVALASLGCKVNQAETDALARRLADAGWVVAGFDDLADAYVLNTCTVTHVADRKARQLLRQARRRNPAGLLVATGCYATTDPASVQAVPGVDLVVPNDRKSDLPGLLEERLKAGFVVAGSSGALPAGRTRAFVKVQDGCDSFCAYCIVPFARGRPRSLPLPEAVRQVRALAEAGCQEVVLTGVHLGLYGRDLAAKPAAGLAELIAEILSGTGMPRLRLSSIEPQDLDEGLLALWADRRLCRHLHLPLQSGCDQTLKRMGRRYTAAGFADLVARARAAVPGLAVTADMIAGLPGETEDEFRTSIEFARDLAFARIHVFQYSARRGTRAAAMAGQVPPAEKQARSRALMALSDEGARRFAGSFRGQELEVLWETRLRGDSGAGLWEGLTDNYIRVWAKAEADKLTNRITPVRLTALDGDVVRGEIIAG